MFLDIDEYETRQFRRAPKKVEHALPAARLQLLERIGSSFVYYTGFTLLCLSIVTAIVTASAYNSPYATPSIKPFLVYGVLLIIGVVTLTTAHYADKRAGNMLLIRRHITANKYRAYFTTQADNSFALLFNAEARGLLNGGTATETTSYLKFADAFLASEVAVFTDDDIRKAPKGLNGIEQTYKAEQEALNALDALYASRKWEFELPFSIEKLKAKSAEEFRTDVTELRDKYASKTQKAEKLLEGNQ